MEPSWKGVHLAEIVSEPGEALEAFMKSCGMVAQSADAEQFGVRLGTTKGR